MPAFFLLLLLQFGITMASESSPPSANDESSPAPLLEAFIELRVNKFRGSGFYRVLVDDDEVPFIDVADAVSHWLDMGVECQNNGNFCQAVLQPAGTRYWIDADQMQMGKEGETPVNLQAGSLIAQGGRIWLRYDVWPQWLPMTTTWTLQNYTLSFHPHFPLLKDLKLARVESRRFQYAEQSRRDYLNKMSPLLPSNDYRAEARYRLRSEISSADNANQSVIDYDMTTDLSRGTLLLSGNMDDSSGVGKVVDSWHYRERNKENYHLLELGYSQNPSSGLFPVFALKNAIRLDRLERRQGGGLFELADWTQAGTEIDVYKNDFLQSTIFTDTEGRYQVENLLVSGGDRVLLRFYYPDGSEEEKIITIAPDNGLILDQRQWDVKVLSGELISNGDDFRYLALRYGLANNLSVGVKEYYLPTVDDNISVLNLDLAWRPLPGVHVLGESFLNNTADDYNLRMDLTLFPSHALSIEKRWLDSNSRLLEVPLLRDPAQDYWRLVHRYGVAKWGWTLDAKEWDERWIAEGKLDYRLNRKMRLLSTHTVQRSDLNVINTATELGLSMTPAENHYIEMRRGVSSSNNNWSILYRHQGGQKRRWDARLGVTKSSNVSPVVSSSMLWRVTRKLSLGLTADKASVGLVVSWNDVLSKNPGPVSWDDFGQGTLSGQIRLPEQINDDLSSARQPLAGVRLRADSKTVMTDDNGRYSITGLPADQRVVVNVDTSTLDASLTPVEDYAVMYFRPGTHIEYSPKLSWTAGLDGYLVNRRALPKDIKIEVVNLDNNFLIATVDVEEDGFFIAEGLVPGQYLLRLSTTTVSFEPYNLELPPGSDWVSGIVWHWGKVEPQS